MDLLALLASPDAPDEPLVRLGRRFGTAVVEAVLDELGGSKPHIPQRENFLAKLERAARDGEIRRRFRGNNYRELADEFGLCERQIKTIVNGQ